MAPTASASTAAAAATYSSPSPRKHVKKPYKSWLKDGVNGGPSSMQIVVQWLSANYATKWRDDSDNRLPKKMLLQEILDQMQQAGIHHRLAKDVASKISTLQSNYRTAREWYDVIGTQWRKAGAQEVDVKKEVLRRFPYWDELHGAFGTTTTVTTTTTTTIAGSVSSRSTMTTMTTHDNSNIVGWPMSIKSIIHDDEKEQRKQDQREQQQSLDQHHYQQEKRHQQLPSLSSMLPYHPTTNINHEQQQQAVATATFAAATAQATLTNAKATTARVIPLSKCTRAFIVSTAIAGNEKTTTVSSPEYVPSSPPTTTTTTTRHPIHHHESSPASGIAYPYYYHHHGVKRRHHHEAMVLAQEQEKTRRVRARADLVKHLVQTGYSKDEIAAELKLCS
ncbi:hypothetical protein RO3G_00343 [Lichtheimia corymbifera JMRC:FSU:9682]|uniref:Uncharacterized protein n=1 Tax=Lichtheimia corymbifera JMRC:FSU:9682 TaxID=1263082 RepID=A0A068S3X7_9FUNG|nr:hypothetical protein RO3G_00343 [Lichtheimia corymbifera JMRC:FSU:9682]